MAKYKLRNTPQNFGFPIVQDIFDTERKVSIPKDPSNTDYAEYLEWVEAGNTAEAAD